ncbi:hypothetical protein GDO86_018740 [Hymenochirus boettgeri]|uniref:Uncharacterized protein n=1 Tax=Hymenochirus boettgeri TaxID=247094 RepID=A0A8T2IFL7_9PIPI|nr:hypothetical protein GDO86_018740 [Hymenochirus boettgeri]
MISTGGCGNVGRLDLPYKGLFLCSQTGIQFRVESSTTIEYQFAFWGDYLGGVPQISFYTTGPVFNINIKAGLVSEVYLPHYVCLGGGYVDIGKFRIAHYKDENLVLESPMRIEPFFAVMENPSFSPVGVVLLRTLPKVFQRNIPMHGAVVMYSRYVRGHTIHLYLMPHDPSIQHEGVTNKEIKNGFSLVDKSPGTRTVYSGRRYIVEGPDGAEIIPEDLKLRLDSRPELYSYSEVYLSEMKDRFFLGVICMNNKKSVWRAAIRKGSQHFVDKHRVSLIQRVSNIDPILDDLLALNILSQEQYDTVRTQRTAQERVRELYDCVRSWGREEKDHLTQKRTKMHCRKKHNKTHKTLRHLTLNAL